MELYFMCWIDNISFAQCVYFMVVVTIYYYFLQKSHFSSSMHLFIRFPFPSTVLKLLFSFALYNSFVPFLSLQLPIIHYLPLFHCTVSYCFGDVFFAFRLPVSVIAPLALLSTINLHHHKCAVCFYIIQCVECQT